MPPRCGCLAVNAPAEPPLEPTVPKASFEPLVQALMGVFQWIAGGNVAPTTRGLLVERLLALGGKEFHGAKGIDPTIVEYWLESVKEDPRVDGMLEGEEVVMHDITTE